MSSDRQMQKIIILIVALITGLGWWWMQDGKAAAPITQYITAPVERGEIRRVISATGTLNAIVNVEVGSQRSGQIARLLIDFNDEVKKGQPLAELDQRSFKAHLAEAQANISLAEANLEVAKARLERARIDARDSEAQRSVLNARTDNAKVKAEAANIELRRKELLQQRQIGTSVELEDARTKAASAAATLREAQAIATAHENNVSGTKADLARVQSELDAAVASLPQRKGLVGRRQNRS
jgi:HlyD family secretion protein